MGWVCRGQRHLRRWIVQEQPATQLPAPVGTRITLSLSRDCRGKSCRTMGVHLKLRNGLEGVQRRATYLRHVYNRQCNSRTGTRGRADILNPRDTLFVPPKPTVSRASRRLRQGASSSAIQNILSQKSALIIYIRILGGLCRVTCLRRVMFTMLGVIKRPLRTHCMHASPRCCCVYLAQGFSWLWLCSSPSPLLLALPPQNGG